MSGFQSNLTRDFSPITVKSELTDSDVETGADQPADTHQPLHISNDETFCRLEEDEAAQKRCLDSLRKKLEAAEALYRENQRRFEQHSNVSSTLENESCTFQCTDRRPLKQTAGMNDHSFECHSSDAVKKETVTEEITISDDDSNEYDEISDGELEEIADDGDEISSKHSMTGSELPTKSSTQTNETLQEVAGIIVEAFQIAAKAFVPPDPQYDESGKISASSKRDYNPFTDISAQIKDSLAKRGIYSSKEVSDLEKHSEHGKLDRSRSSSEKASANSFNHQQTCQSSKDSNRGLENSPEEALNRAKMAYQQLRSLKIKPDETAIQYLRRARELGKISQLTDAQVRHYIMNGLASILELEDLEDTNHSSASAPSPKSAVQGPPISNKRSHPSFQGYRGYIPRKKLRTITCRKCHKRGHFTHDCDQDILFESCYKCHKVGHVGKFCPEKKKSADASTHNSISGANNYSLPRTSEVYLREREDQCLNPL